MKKTDCGACACGYDTEGNVLNQQDKAMFLTKMGLVMEKYDIVWGDIDVNWDVGTIDIKADLQDATVYSFLADLHEVTGGFD